MPSSRRTFLKTSLIAGAGAALPTLPALAASGSGNAPAAAPALLPETAFTRGIGVYPGAADAFFGPNLVIDTTTYRNVALHRTATQSSAYDYNLTAQLVTDGIIHTTPPRWIASGTSSDGILPKHLRETLVSHWPAATLDLHGGRVTAYLELGGGTSDTLPVVDHIAIFTTLSRQFDPSRVSITVAISADGRVWEPVGSIAGPPIYDGQITYPPDLNRGNNLFYPTIALSRPCQSRFYQVELVVQGVAEEEISVAWRLGQMEFYHGAQRVQIGGPYDFTSAWMSEGLGEEWVAVDFGAPATFDRVNLHWIARAAEGAIQTSNDGETWHTLKPLPPSTSQLDAIHIAPPARARHLRVLMTRPTSPDGYILSELEVFGRGGLIARPAPIAAPTPDGRLNFAGLPWRVQRSSEVQATGESLSQPRFNDMAWLPASIPATTLTSYQNAGAIPDPNFGQNQLSISDSFFYSDFWYRTTFNPPPAADKALRWLDFAGIDWKAEVFLNGTRIGEIAGGFTRARFDVTRTLHADAENSLAIRILKNATPGSCKQKTYDATGVNGGALGADNPTFHASIGWDWIPTVRGRNTGIWGDIVLASTHAVTIDSPFVTSTLPRSGKSSSTISIAVDLVNHSSQPIQGTLHANFGTRQLQQTVTLATGSQRVTLDPFELADPQLWWPVGYGEPHLYKVEVWFMQGDIFSDSRSFQHGIRQMTATEDGGNLRLFINGRRFIARGGNWGFAEVQLRYRAREYDAAVRYHREMNFTMIRNWVGQIPDDAFYEACDRHGIVVWQDFWLANPWDGPIPDDNALFLANARDLILRIRTHASVGLYVGRNEGFPPPPLETGLRALLQELHPEIHYIGSSADGPVSGHGPYRALPPTFYFQHADAKLHSEIGMPNIPTIESVRAMMSPSGLWPQGLEWGLHDFTIHGAQGGSSFLSLIEDGYGGARNAEEWVTLAQFLNYEGYRAIFEAQSKDRMGVLLWMSHPCWPSFVWQTYDWYLEPTAAYFGCKKASEPLHIQWNRFTGFIEVVNLSAGNQPNLTATVKLFNLDGSSPAQQQASISSAEDSVIPAIKVSYPADTLTPVHFLRLTLSRGATILSSNLYLRGHEEGNYRAIRELAKIKLQATTAVQRKEAQWLLTTTVKNPSKTPALLVRLKAIRESSGDRILPVIYSDNYITLMPGESQTITTELNHADTRGEHPQIVLSGFNVA